VSPRIGFLGAGLIAHFHALQLSGCGEAFTFAGVFDPDARRSASFGAGWGATACASEAEVLDTADAIYVCSWTSEHARLVGEAVSRRLPVFCEKPLAFDAAGAEAMADAVDGAGVPNQVGLVLRHSPAFGLLKHLVNDPAAGRVMSVTFRDDQYIPVQGMYASVWRGDRTKAGAGTLIEHAVHDVDILEHCIGPVISVSSRSANFHGLDGIEDSVATVVELAGGGVGVHSTIWHDVMERPSLRRVEVFCERRYVSLENDWDGPVHWTTSGQEPVTVDGEALLGACRSAGVRLASPDADFIRAVGGGPALGPTIRDAVRPHRLVDAIYRSAAEGGRAVAV